MFDHPWDIRNIDTIFWALLVAITDPAILEPIRIAFFSMHLPAPPQIILPSIPNAMERDGDATDEEDEPEPEPKQPTDAELLALEIHEKQERKNNSANGGVTRANARGRARADPYGRSKDAGHSNPSNGRRAAAGPSNQSNARNAEAGPGKHPNALRAGARSNGQRNAEAGPSKHPNALREARPSNNSNKRDVKAKPSSHSNALRPETGPRDYPNALRSSNHSTRRNPEAGPSNHPNALRTEAGPSNHSTSRNVLTPDDLDLGSLNLNHSSPTLDKGKGKQRADNLSHSVHQLPTSSLLNQSYLPHSRLSSEAAPGVFEEQSSSNKDAGVSSASSGFVPTLPAPAQEQLPPSHPTTTPPSLLSRLSARAEAPAQPEPSPVPVYPVFEAARPQYGFQEQLPAPAWNTEQPASANWVPINNDAQATAFRPEEVFNNVQAKWVQIQPNAQQSPAYLYDEDTNMDTDFDMDTAWVPMNQHAQHPQQQPEMPQTFEGNAADTWVQTQPRAQQQQQQFAYDGSSQNAWASTSYPEQSGGNLANAWVPTQSAQQVPSQAYFGGEVDSNWVQMNNHAQQLQEQGHYDPNTFQPTQAAPFQQQAQDVPYTQPAYGSHNERWFDSAAAQLQRANDTWRRWISMVQTQEPPSTFVPSPAPTFDAAPPPPQSQPTPEEAASEKRFWDMVRRAEGDAPDRRRNPVNYAAASARGPSATGYLNRKVAEVPVGQPRLIRSLPGRAGPFRPPQVVNGPLGSEANLQYRLDQERRLEEQARRHQPRAEPVQPPTETPSKQRKRRRDDATPLQTPHTPAADDEPTPSKRARSEPPKVDAGVQVEVEAEVDTRTRLISGGSNGVVSWNTYARLAARREKKERKTSRFCPSLSSITGFFSSRLAFMKS